MTLPPHKFQELGEFLRIRREAIKPEAVGLPPRARRRTAGLRREDMVMLAGVSLSWYTWLEQGRDIRPSTAVLLGIARALRLSQDDITYMFDLAGQPRPSGFSELREHVTPALQHFLDALDLPAYVLTERWDRIGWNVPLLALMGDFSGSPLIERNILWRAFVDLRTRSYPLDWKETARRAMAEFQASTSRYVNEPWMVEFVESMSAASPEFRTWWPQRNVLQRREKLNVIRHPEAGTMHFEHLSFNLADDPQLMMSVFTPLDLDNSPAKLRAVIARFRSTSRKE